MRHRRASVVVLLLSAVACVDPAPPEPPPLPAVTTTVAAARPSGDRGSLYDLPVTLTDPGGRDVRLVVHRGRPVLVSMFYSSCPAACPTLIADIRKIDARLSASERERVRVLLVSMDPAKDSPESFRKLAELHGLDLERWTLGLARESDVRMVAAALDIKYRFLPDGNISHSTVIAILRDDGGIDLQVEGLGRDNDDVVARLKELAGQS
jgi:protein SCO1/2